MEHDRLPPPARTGQLPHGSYAQARNYKINDLDIYLIRGSAQLSPTITAGLQQFVCGHIRGVILEEYSHVASTRLGVRVLWNRVCRHGTIAALFKSLVGFHFSQTRA